MTKVEIRKGFKIENCLREISNARTLLGDGSYSTPGFTSLDGHKSFLTTALSIQGRTTAFAQAVVDKAISKRQTLTTSSFLKDARKEANALSKKERKLKVVFPLWKCDGLLIGTRKVNCITLNFSPNIDSRFVNTVRSARQKQLDNHKRSEEMHELSNFPLAVVTVDAVNCFDAFQKAERAIHCELGILSFLLARGVSIIPENPRRPIARCLIAPHMTVHRPSGVLEADIFWYDEWADSYPAKDLSQDEQALIQSHISRIRRSLSGLPWRTLAENALIRHYNAFSQLDSEHAFLEGWKLLELISGENFAKSETLVRRASSFFNDSDYMRDIGLHLLHRRNLASHGRRIDGNDHQTLAFQMRSFLAPIMRHVIFNPFKFLSLNELWEFADMDMDRDKRIRRLHILRSVASFRQERPYPDQK